MRDEERARGKRSHWMWRNDVKDVTGGFQFTDMHISVLFFVVFPGFEVTETAADTQRGGDTHSSTNTQ